MDRTHLGDRLVYFRVRGAGATCSPQLEPRSLARKLAMKPDSEHYEWLLAELARRFDYACCDDLVQFRREKQAVTRTGQVKGAGEKHEKDDRSAIDDRSRYVLGWTNEAKIAALEGEVRALQARLGEVGARIAAGAGRVSALRERLDQLGALAVFQSFRDLDWRTPAAEIEALEQERLRLEAASDRLRVLQEQLSDVLARLEALGVSERQLRESLGGARTRRESCRSALRDCEEVVAAATDEDRTRFFPALESMREEALEGRALTVESAESRERELRDFLQARLDAEQKKIERLGEKIVKAMEAYRNAFPLDAREADASLDAADEYRRMLQALVSDDLPRFERKFKELLNENTIREIAGFHAQLQRERQVIRERIEEINRSLRTIDYNPNRALWVQEEGRYDGDLAGLTAPEMALFEDLRRDRLGERVRLEQERIGFRCVEEALRALEPK